MPQAEIAGRKIPKWLLLSATIFFSIIFLAGALLLGVTELYAGKIFPGVKINGFSLGGQTIDQAKQVIAGEMNSIYKDEFSFTYQNLTKKLPLKTVADIQYDKMTARAFEIGREGNLPRRLLSRLQILLAGRELPIEFSLNKSLIEKDLHEKFAAIESPAKNSEIVIKAIDKNSKTFSIDFSEEAPGTAIDMNKAFGEISANILGVKNSTIQLSVTTDQPQISKAQAQTSEKQIRDFMKDRQLTLLAEDQKFVFSWADIIYWINLKLDDNKQIALTLDKDTVIGQLEAIAQKINRSPQDAKLNIVNNKASEFQASQNGLELDIEQSLAKIENDFVSGLQKEITLVVKETEPNVKIESLNDLGIKELIGVGTSDFSGSPSNRRHNIGVGAASLNGLLIKPGEEFSLIKALGSIDAQNGYLPELVIKGDKTLPEFGGGLCQVGTTTFRVALNAGLPITERRNHSYRVIYYEPAGTDATIYDPKPDLRFVNDTANYILFQTKMVGNILRFEFWGTKDGRKVVQTKPEIYNITQPGPTKIVETQDLKPGQKKCTESAHAGADAIFYRTVTYANGDKKEDVWKSHYVPWQAVCLVGVEKPTTPPADPTVEIPLTPDSATPTVPPTT